MVGYVFIDFESIQPDNLAVLAKLGFQIVIFIGANQNKLPAELVIELQPWGKQVHYIRVTGQGRNALDFHISYYLGWFARNDKNAQFYIISKDKGFDPLIAHLHTNGIVIKRIDNLTVDMIGP